MSSLAEQIASLIQEAVRVEVAKVRNDERASDEYLSAATAGRIAGVSSQTIRQWVRDGCLADHRAGKRIRVSRAELEGLLKQGRRRAVELSPEALARRDFG